MPVGQHPLGPPTVSGNDVTVDTMLEQPTRVTRFLSDITLQDFLLEDLFVSAGGVSGGAVIYDMPTVNELYPERDVQQVEVGAEFPVLTSDRRAPLVVALPYALANTGEWIGNLAIVLALLALVLRWDQVRGLLLGSLRPKPNFTTPPSA